MINFHVTLYFLRIIHFLPSPPITSKGEFKFLLNGIINHYNKYYIYKLDMNG